MYLLKHRLHNNHIKTFHVLIQYIISFLISLMILPYLHTMRYNVTEKNPFLFLNMIKMQKRAANAEYQQNL